MASMLELSLRVDQLPKEKFVKGKNGAVYYKMTVSVSDETNQWGQNVAAWDAQSKEEREAGSKRQYVGNGKVFWTNGEISAADRVDQEQPQAELQDDNSSLLDLLD